MTIPQACLLLILFSFPAGCTTSPHSTATPSPWSLPVANLRDVDSLAFSPDGQTIAVTSQNNTIILFNAATLIPHHTLTGHGGPVRTVAFTSNGSLLASASDDGTVMFWDTKTGQCRNVRPVADARILTLAFAPDGKTLAASSSDGKIQFWNLEGTLQHILDNETPAYHLAFSPDGKFFASTAAKEIITLWDPATGKPLRQLKSPNDMLRDITFSPDSKTFAAVNDGGVALWDTATGQRQPALADPGWAWGYNGLAFSPDGNTLAAGSMEGLILWDIKSRKFLRKMVELRTTTCLAFNPEGDSLAVGLQHTFFGTYNLATGAAHRPPKSLDRYHGMPNSLAFAPHGNTLAVGTGNDVVLWNLATGKPQNVLGERIDQHCAAYEIAFNPDGSQLVGWLGHPWPFGPIEFWNTADGKTLRTFTMNDRENNETWSEVYALAPDGITLAVQGENDAVILCNTAAKTQRLTLTRSSHDILTMTFSPDGKTLAAGTRLGNVILWDPATGTIRRTLSFPQTEITSLAFTPDSQALAIGQQKGQVSLFDPISGELRRTLTAQRGSIRSLAFSPDGKALASAADDASIILWDPATGTIRRKLTGHACPVTAVAFSTDGTLLASASQDASVILWDPATGAQRGTLYSQTKEWWLALSPTGAFACSDPALADLSRLANDQLLPRTALAPGRRQLELHLAP